ncbi:cyclin-A2-like protein [Dinothrombium tinctorium]|uniref:Cyclin-A2-like protein n=1 Tax=Dinothrombium tinctorium TaxID=1965070 RepID=A0A443RJ92_9ACAR|nr:cyclin-A2-like protein [Dinothrombium tinctorium]
MATISRNDQQRDALLDENVVNGNNKRQNAAAKSERNPLAPVDPRACNNAKLKQRQPLGAVCVQAIKSKDKPNSETTQTVPAVKQAVIKQTTNLAKEVKLEKGVSFEIFCDDVIEEKNVAKREKPKNETNTKIKIEKENEENVDKENVNITIKHEDDIVMNSVSTDERKQLENDNSSVCDEQVANIMSMVIDVIETDKVEDEECNRAVDEIFLDKCKEYSEEICVYLMKYEANFRPDPNYMQRQQDVNAKMRSILVDWMVEVADEYRLSDETLFLSVGYIDREKENVQKLIKARQSCVDAMHKMQKFASKHPQQAICQKFAVDKYARVSLMAAKETSPDIAIYFN